ncbi:MAG: cytochrome-c oxidase, cbb3-type subunit I [Phycisphaerales bacterium]|nr:cytochrome-c oxidase, cbb3-type subunit I [Phycisphaerales bacterium]
MATSDAEMVAGGLETFTYDDAIVRKFALATYVWGVVGLLVGVLIALQLVAPAMAEKWPGAFGWMKLLFQVEWLTFGRLRPLHTNAAIFAFAGNGVFTAIYYSTQRLCKARMFSDVLSNLHFWGWQLIIVCAALTIPLGITTGKEYAELEWPIDLLIAVVWVGFFGVNFFGTLARRRERHLYVALWFYIATIVTVAVLHVFNSLEVPAGWLKSYSVYAGVQDALVQWWYGHNAVAFFLTTPFLGLMYYFLPKAAERPVFSYRLSILHFWSLVFVYIWAGPHHLHYTSLPGWASTLGMTFSLMLWMPSWGGMINGLFTLRGTWDKITTDPVLKFFLVGVTFYGMSTFEGPLLSVKAVNSLSHYTDWTIGHVHGGTLGWNGMMIFGMLYWLWPRIYQTPLASKKLAEWHFWLATIGIFMYWISMQWAGITQGLMWRGFTDAGALAYPDFVETVTKLMPLYAIRAVGGGLFFLGALLGGVNLLGTWVRRPKQYEVIEHQAPPLARKYTDPELYHSPVENTLEVGRKLDEMTQLEWHRKWEHLPVRFTVWVLISVGVASIFSLVPMFVIRSNVPTIESIKPYSPLELYGRQVYIAEGCYNCHSQMIRPLWAETERYGPYSQSGEFVYDHPFQWGSRRIGPDLARVGGKYNHDWHVRHLEDPRILIAGSIMPAYKHLLNQDIPWPQVRRNVDAMVLLGVPYSDDERASAIELAKAQATRISGELIEQGGYEDLDGKKILALVAYLQRLGVDIKNLAVEGGE